MQKSKLGISVALVGAALYFSGLFSGYLAIMAEEGGCKVSGAAYVLFHYFGSDWSDSGSYRFY